MVGSDMAGRHGSPVLAQPYTSKSGQHWLVLAPHMSLAPIPYAQIGKLLELSGITIGFLFLAFLLRLKGPLRQVLHPPHP